MRTRILFFVGFICIVVVFIALQLSSMRGIDLQNKSPETNQQAELLPLFQQGNFKRVSQLLLEKRSTLDHLSGEQLFQMGERLAKLGWISAAEVCFQKAVESHPRAGRYRLRLAMLQYVCGRYSDALEQWEVLLVNGGLDLISFPALGNRSLRWQYEDKALELGMKHKDPLCLFGLAVRALNENDLSLCEKLARQALSRKPDLIEANLIIGQVLYESGRKQEFQTWVSKLPVTTDKFPDAWILRGHYYRELGLIDAGLQCYWEAFHIDPCHYVAADQLGRMLYLMKRDKDAQKVMQRATFIRQYADVCRKIHSHELVTESHLRSVVALSTKLSCTREAIGWCEIAEIVYPNSQWPTAIKEQLRSDNSIGLERIHKGSDPRLLVKLERTLLPKIEIDVSTEPVEAGQDTIRFADVTKATGLDFIYEDGADLSTTDTLLFEFTGGGVAVLDYDRNGWPDLFFTQGGPPPLFHNPTLEAEQVYPSDKFYSQCSTGSLQDTTELAGLVDSLYGQGVSVGDFNSDGFSDMYVANIGANTLYENMGDGTFQKLEQGTLVEGASWTTSCLMADLDGDAHPDLYDVNYVIPEAIHTEMCISGEASVPCSVPHQLVPAIDRLLINQGDGSLIDSTESSGTAVENGLGLGIVAADFGGDGKIDLFVANDARPNFLFINQTAPGQSLIFSEEALVRGVAFSEAGREQACMGVAADDANGDGVIDLFITNFYADYNIFYQQLPGGFFEDRTQFAGLKMTSYHSLGFGTQFLDADLDGDSDIILTNGDVVDFQSVQPSRHYKQNPQFIENLGNGKFSECSPQSLGPFFEEALLGRGLARLDWNRDGIDEFVVSHIGMPARLLENRTKTTRHYLKVQLVGTRCNRDAIGTRVSVVTNEMRTTRQLTAGDGYHASNERTLTFGLSSNHPIDEVIVSWPSGDTDRFQDISVDQTVLLIQSSKNPFHLPVE